MNHLDIISPNEAPGLAMAHYQQFKVDKVGTWEGEWRIAGAQIDEWLAKECGVL